MSVWQPNSSSTQGIHPVVHAKFECTTEGEGSLFSGDFVWKDAEDWRDAKQAQLSALSHPTYPLIDRIWQYTSQWASSVDAKGIHSDLPASTLSQTVFPGMLLLLRRAWELSRSYEQNEIDDGTLVLFHITVSINDGKIYSMMTVIHRPTLGH